MFDRLKGNLHRLYDNLSKTELKGEKAEKILEEFKLTLIENDVALEVAEDMVGKAYQRLSQTPVPRVSDKKKLIADIFQKVVEEALSQDSIKLVDLIKKKIDQEGPLVLLFLGVNGTGKTTTIAKVAQYLKKNGYTTVLACSDTFRTGAIEQLEEHARRIGVRVIKHKYGADAAAIAYDSINFARSHGVNAVLIDTAGRMHTDRNLMEEIKKIVRIATPDLKILVVDSLTANDAIEQCRVFDEAVGIDAVILTKLDADAKGGAALTILSTINRPILFIGVGQDYNDLTFFSSTFILKNLFNKEN